MDTKKGYKEGKMDLLKAAKITYCVNSACPYGDCYKHLTKVKDIEDKNGHVNIADFSGVCRRYISYLVEELTGDNCNEKD